MAVMHETRKLYTPNESGGWDYTYVNCVNDEIQGWMYLNFNGQYVLWPADQDGENPPSGGGGDGGGGDGGGGDGGGLTWLPEWEPFRGEASDLSAGPNPNWPALPDALRPWPDGKATGWPPYDSIIWQGEDNNWNLRSPDGSLWRVCNPEGVTIRWVIILPTGETLNLPLNSPSGQVVGPRGTFELPWQPMRPDDPQVRAADNISYEAYYRNRALGLSPGASRAAANAEIEAAGLGAANTGFIVAEMANQAYNAYQTRVNKSEQCHNYKPLLVVTVAQVQRFLNRADAALAWLQTFCQSAAGEVGALSGSPYYAGFYDLAQLVYQYRGDPLAGWIAEAAADLDHYQQYNCDDLLLGCDSLLAAYTSDTVNAKWTPRLAQGGNTPPLSALMMWATVSAQVASLVEQSGVLTDLFTQMPNPGNPGDP